MKKSTKKTVNYLSRYIGLEVVRTKPVDGDWICTSDPILLLGFTKDGCIRFRYTGWLAEFNNDKESLLPNYCTDRNWITYSKALRAKHNKLNEWKGKKIKRICPTCKGGCSFMSEYGFEHPATLISASKYHVVIKNNDELQEGHISFLNADYNKPEDWVLTE